jgi:hypothetical protein
MTIKELKEKIANLPDDMKIIITNYTYEWYGAEEVKNEAVAAYRDCLAIDFSCEDFDENSKKQIDRDIYGE